MPDPSEWVERHLAAKLERLRHGNDVTLEMLRRSREHIDLSLDLLKDDVPKVWPEQTGIDTGTTLRTVSDRTW